MIESPVVMSNSRGISADTIAEHVIAVTLAMFRKLPLVFAPAGRAGSGRRIPCLRDPPLRTIAGSNVLVIGLGAIGMATARRMSALGARVTAIRRDPDATPPEGVERVGAAGASARRSFPTADIVVLAAPQTRETPRLIGARELAAMRRDALLVNVSRGKLVDETCAGRRALLAPAGRTIGAPRSTSSTASRCRPTVRSGRCRTS